MKGRSQLDMSPFRAVLGDLDVPVRDVFVLSRRNAVAPPTWLADLLPEATVHMLSPRPLRDLLATMARIPQPQLIVDLAPRPGNMRRALFDAAFPFLAAGGAFVIRAAAGDQAAAERDQLVEDLARIVEGQAQSRKRGAAPVVEDTTIGRGDISVRSRLIVVRQRLEQRYKVRDSDANELLQSRFGSTWGRVVAVRPGRSYTSRADVTRHGAWGPWKGVAGAPITGETIDVPSLSLREYTNVTCWAQQRVARDNYWLPDTFRHHLHRNLTHRSLHSNSATHARLPKDTPQPGRQIDVPCFYFDSEYAVHFGHFLTEPLARAWGWGEAVAIEPDLRPLISLPLGRKELPAYQRQLFEALDIDVSRVEFVALDEAVRIKTLFAATPAFAMPQYAAPDLEQTWSSIARVLVRRGADTPRRLFVTRRPRHIRSCLNTEEVEAFFADLGFDVIYPEDHDLSEQITMFANADVIAGYAGSGLFNLMFTQEKTVILICPDSYTATNEHLIASVVGGRLHYFPAEAEIKHPEQGWKWAAYQSNFRFDVRRHGDEIVDVVGDRAHR